MLPDTLALFLTKLLLLIVYPLGLTLSLVAAGALLRWLGFSRLARLCLGAALAILWLASSPVVANWAIASLERQHAIRTIAETAAADVAIVLGGAVGQPLPPRTAPDLTDASDRLLHAARLYRAGKAGRILVSAGNLPWLPAARPEAQLIKEVLVEWGVPPGAIEIGTAARNTYENALEVRRMLEARGATSALLVTSAAHMPRAMATFRRAGVPVTASPTDVVAVAGDRAGPLGFLPQASALALTTSAVKEWLGYLAYRVRGYL